MIRNIPIRFLLIANALALLFVAWLLLSRNSSPQPAPLLVSHPAPPVSPIFPVTTESPAYSRLSPSHPANDAPLAAGAPAAPRPLPSASVDPAITPPLPQLALYPVAFADPRPEDHFTPDQMQILRTLRSDFATALAENSHLSPSSQEYFDRWMDLKDDFDSQFRARFGTDTYMRFQHLALESEARSAR